MHVLPMKPVQNTKIDEHVTFIFILKHHIRQNDNSHPKLRNASTHTSVHINYVSKILALAYALEDGACSI